MKNLVAVLILSLLMTIPAAAHGHGRESSHTSTSWWAAAAAVAILAIAAHHSPSQVVMPAQPVMPLAPIGVAPSYEPLSVVTTQGDKIIVNHPFLQGTRLWVMGRWITDPNSGRPLYREHQALLIVDASDGVTSLAEVVQMPGLRNFAWRGDDVEVVPPLSAIPLPMQP